MDKTKGLPALPGVGYKPQHFAAILVVRGRSAGWKSTPRTTWARAAARWRSCGMWPGGFQSRSNGVGLSIGGEGALDREHLAAEAPLQLAEPRQFLGTPGLVDA